MLMEATGEVIVITAQGTRRSRDKASENRASSLWFRKFAPIRCINYVP